jgi:hypothetical protein
MPVIALAMIAVLPGSAKTGSSQYLKNGDPKAAAITPEIVNPVA